MGYLFVGFLALWALIFGYVFSISARQRTLEKRIDALSTSDMTNEGS